MSVMYSQAIASPKTTLNSAYMKKKSGMQTLTPFFMSLMLTAQATPTVTYTAVVSRKAQKSILAHIAGETNEM